MANQYTATPIPSGVEELYNQGFTQAEIAQGFGVSQKMVFGWFKKLGIKSRIAAKRNQWGENNTYWKGDNASYQAKHHWIEKQLGKPRICQNCGSKNLTYRGAYEWANVGHTYRRILNEWIRLCRPCHRKHDKLGLSVTSNYSLE